MRPKLKLPRIRQWPRAAAILLGLGLAGLAIVLGLLLEPVGYALSPGHAVPTPTLPAIKYGQTTSDSCRACHFSLAALEESATDTATVDPYLIEPASMAQPHGMLGCVSCHSGDGDAEDKEAAHQGLITDLTTKQPEQCLICHRDLPSDFVNDRLRVPHVVISDRVEHGDACQVHCSDCHGAVGHGFDPTTSQKFCSMTACLACHAEEDACLDCHQQNGPEIGMTGCDVCHIGPHDVADTITCNCCHISTKTWYEIQTDIHPVSMSGKHDEIGCFECHTWPNFRGLRYVCTDCHEPAHKNWGTHSCPECHDPGESWDTVADIWSGHSEHWSQYRGQHLDVRCRGCHFETFTDLDPSCDNCHAPPESHGSENNDCLECH